MKEMNTKFKKITFKKDTNTSDELYEIIDEKELIQN
jgi:hypothetical protein